MGDPGRAGLKSFHGRRVTMANKDRDRLMDDDDKIHDFVDSSIRRSIWVIPFAKWQKYQDKIKKNEPDDE